MLDPETRPDHLPAGRVLLTGASSGIGRALALRLAAEGWRLALVARREPELAAVAAEAIAAGAPVAEVIAADLAVPGRAAQVAAEATERLGAIDLLVNNAGSSPLGGIGALGDDAAVRAGFEINLWSPLALTRAVLPGMLAAGRGTVVNVTSTIQAVPIPLVGYYGASKAALATATRALRHELRETPIRVVEVVPGSTKTALRDVDRLPWRGRPPRTAPAIAPEAMAAAIVRGLRGDRDRIVHPTYAAAPLELPFVGRAVSALAARRIDSSWAMP